MHEVAFALGLSSAFLALLFGVFGTFNGPKDVRRDYLFVAIAFYRPAVILLLIALLAK